MGIHWTGIVFGLGAVISMGYWTTDFLVVQRILAAKDMRSAEMAPIIGAGFKMMVPLIVILPGLLGLAVLPMKLTGEATAAATGGHSYNDVLPLNAGSLLWPGTARPWNYRADRGLHVRHGGQRERLHHRLDLRHLPPLDQQQGQRSSLREHGPLDHGRLAYLISVGTAYLVMQFASIMDYVQALFSFFIAPLFGTVVLGMLWKRATGAGGFWGLLCGTGSSIGMWAWVKLDPTALRYVALSPNAKALAQDMYQALVVISGVRDRDGGGQSGHAPKTDAELTGLVYGLTKVPSIGDVPFYQKPLFWAGVVVVVFFILNIIFW